MTNSVCFIKRKLKLIDIFWHLYHGSGEQILKTDTKNSGPIKNYLSTSVFGLVSQICHLWEIFILVSEVAENMTVTPQHSYHQKISVKNTFPSLCICGRLWPHLLALGTAVSFLHRALGSSKVTFTDTVRYLGQRLQRHYVCDT